MKIAGCSLAIGVFAAAALAKLQITLPNSHTEWEAGSLQTIKWKPIDGNLRGRVSIELMEGSDSTNMGTVTTIAENIPASDMEHHWNVPKGLKSSKNYSIKLVDDGGEEYYGQYFKGSMGKPGKDAGNSPKEAADTSAKDQPQQKSSSGPQAGSKKESKPQKKTGAGGSADSAGGSKLGSKGSSSQTSSTGRSSDSASKNVMAAGYVAMAAAVAVTAAVCGTFGV
ncbi:hypothetical protein EV175_001477 [Coemansia sp. RSA 1933]|nr:hypothetical protein EV175_001477 [Coemansia sp. RSA 1933]